MPNRIDDDTEAAPIAPIAEAMLKLRSIGYHSYHALPLSGGKSVSGTALEEVYEELFGFSYLASEMTVGDTVFDCFFFPQSVIKRAQELAAQAFGADQSLFVTAGSSTSNRIAIDALLTDATRVLVDRSCHQSIHLSLHGQGVEIAYADSELVCPSSGRRALDIPKLIRRLRTAEANGRPFDTVVLNGASYEGVMYDFERVFAECAEFSRSPRFMVDEAWSGAHCFHPYFGSKSAIRSASTLRDRGFGDRFEVISTHSGHKSMSTLRQASFLHVVGGQRLAERVTHSHYKLHTTSPSYPILASLDLARAQMQADGVALVGRSLELAESFVSAVESDPRLSCYSVDRRINLSQGASAYVSLDPTKISLNVAELGIGGEECRRLLIERYRVYVSRYTPTSILLNIHLGVSAEWLAHLLDSLRELQAERLGSKAVVETSTRFVIPYPPGVPIVFPGDAVTSTMECEISALVGAGVRVFEISV